MTGITSKIIRSGSILALLNSSTTLNLFEIFNAFWPLEDSKLSFKFFERSFKSNPLNIFNIASAPISALQNLST